ncbi:3-hydroxyacyl-CoA dehydrogenase NAD-binding protein [Desulfurispirillum indicum S5]|uniref:3-hydroxyacyl-CoA dehydrogenase NAD-binding protein n=1 Tax=Desulfurispirillum indicum (strain ATCC BAA-1389 / DSM 22839 / S5) TaxID=653733 RepID=E6W697_DESIS|nr:3-hydroxybutyryl-CoA dehydrogenase [Desulfurispirillum indicum]ADU66133.1 3-hydroxyacyl-CoA dehydrogenase NAD-binding protein [Desulfurispirillum indicum S5]
MQYIGVVGAGQMGSGIAQVCAQYGYKVIIHDMSEEQLKRCVAGIEKNLIRQVEKGKLEENAIRPILGRIGCTRSLKEFQSCDIAIEAVTEKFMAKLETLQHLDDILKPEAIIASNTSSISITRLASNTRRPERFIGLHFMNPVPVMGLVEIIRGLGTSEETFSRARQLVESMDKEVAISADYPGFIVNRILIPMINEAICTLHEGVATAEDIDLAMRLGTNQPMGPLALADLIGLDTVLSIMEVLFDGFKDSKYRPCPLLTQMVAAGRLGRKSGQGFYSYP